MPAGMPGCGGRGPILVPPAVIPALAPRLYAPPLMGWRRSSDAQIFTRSRIAFQPSAVFAPSADFVANMASPQQSIDGLGACGRNGGDLTSVADQLWSPSLGIGLSLDRASIESDGTYVGFPANSVAAYERGAKVWAAPWTPPDTWKDSGTFNNGGALFPARYGDWADRLCAFVTMMASAPYNVPIYGVSVQNEPDFAAPSWDSCVYSTSQMIDFIKVFGPKLAALSPRPKLISPESANWGGLWSYVDAIRADATAASYLDVVATHDYTYSTSAGDSGGRPIWETEVSTFDGEDGGLSNGLNVASWIHRAFAEGNCSAWHYWAYRDFSADNQGLLLQDSSPTKRFYAVGNWSKFVRPGWVRLGTTGAGVSGVSVTAFRDPENGDFAIVAINANGAPTSVSFGIAGPGCSSVAPWVTSGTSIGAIGTDGNLSLGSTAASLSTSLPMTGNALTLTLPVGVTTLVGVAA